MMDKAYARRRAYGKVGVAEFAGKQREGPWMNEPPTSETGIAPPRQLPWLHAVFSVVAGGLLYAPLLHLGDGGVRTLMDLGAGWAFASLVLLMLLALASVLLIVADRVSWIRLLSVDMLVLVALLPVVLGVVVRWEVPAAGVAGFAWGFWAAIVLVLLRLPLSVWIRMHAARAQASMRGSSTPGA